METRTCMKCDHEYVPRKDTSKRCPNCGQAWNSPSKRWTQEEKNMVMRDEKPPNRTKIACARMKSILKHQPEYQ